MVDIGPQNSLAFPYPLGEVGKPFYADFVLHTVGVQSYAGHASSVLGLNEGCDLGGKCEGETLAMDNYCSYLQCNHSANIFACY